MATVYGKGERDKPEWQKKREREYRDASLRRYTEPVSSGYGMGKLPPVMHGNKEPDGMESPTSHKSDSMQVIRTSLASVTGILPEREMCQKAAFHFHLDLESPKTLQAIQQQITILKNTAEFEMECQQGAASYRDALLQVARNWWANYRQQQESRKSDTKEVATLRVEAFYVAGILRRMLEKK